MKRSHSVFLALTALVASLVASPKEARAMAFFSLISGDTSEASSYFNADCMALVLTIPWCLLDAEGKATGAVDEAELRENGYTKSQISEILSYQDTLAAKLKANQEFAVYSKNETRNGILKDLKTIHSESGVDAYASMVADRLGLN